MKLSKLSIVKRAPPYSNITKTCIPYLKENIEIIKYPNPDELVNKLLELVCNYYRHSNKSLLAIVNLKIELPVKSYGSVTSVTKCFYYLWVIDLLFDISKIWFHKDGPMNDKVFRPEFNFRKGCLNFKF